MEIEYDDSIEDVLCKINDALRKYDLEIVDDGREHDGFIIAEIIKIEVRK